MAIIVPADFKVYYPQLVGTGEDPVITILIAAADELLAEYCGFPPTGATHVRTLASTTYSVRYDGPSSQPDVLCLCVSPLVSVQHVYVDTARLYGASTELVAGTDYDLDLVRGMIGLLPGGSLEAWPAAWNGIKVDFTAGYTAGRSLTAIVAAEVRHLWDRRRTQGEEALTDFGQAVTLRDQDVLIPAAVKDALAAYMVCK